MYAKEDDASERDWRREKKKRYFLEGQKKKITYTVRLKKIGAKRRYFEASQEGKRGHGPHPLVKKRHSKRRKKTSLKRRG